MAELSIKYKDIEIASLSASDTKVLTTKGMYCEDDITVTYTRPNIPTFTTEAKTVTPTESIQEVTPTSADGLSKVTVNAIASDYVGSSVNRKTATTISPTESVQTAVSTGTYTTGDIKVGAISSTYVGSGIAKRSSTDLSTNGATVTVPSGYYSSQATKSVATGSAGTPSASKGSVSNHSVSITPTVTNTTGYITGGTKNGTPVTVSASELVSGSETKNQNGTYDVTNLAQLVVDVPTSGGSSKNIQTYIGYKTVNQTSYTATGVSITVEESGTYTVSWIAYRNRNSGTFGSQLFINNSAYGSANTTWVNTYGQSVTLSNVSLTKGQTVEIHARSGNTSYVIGVGNLIIQQV